VVAAAAWLWLWGRRQLGGGGGSVVAVMAAWRRWRQWRQSNRIMLMCRKHRKVLIPIFATINKGGNLKMGNSQFLWPVAYVTNTNPYFLVHQLYCCLTGIAFPGWYFGSPFISPWLTE
jgi:hypothetical protein